MSEDTKTIDGVTYEAIKGKGCMSCVGFDSERLCNALQPCLPRTRTDGRQVAFQEATSKTQETTK